MENKILLGLVVLALAVVFHALAARFDVIPVADGDGEAAAAVYRIDRLTGRLWLCANDQCLKVRDIERTQTGERT
jgi:hypothetical protein